MVKLEDINNAEHAIPLDRDLEGNVIHTEDIVAYVNSELEKRRDDRQVYELQWTLNANFLQGNQHCEINTNMRRIQQQDALYSWQEYNCYNKIAPLYDTRMALLSTVSYDMTVKPRTNELDDYDKALITSEILRYTQDTSGFNALRIQALSWAELTGTVFWLSWWDKYAGDEIARETITETGDDGAPIQKTKVTYSGDLKYGLLTCYEVFPESLYKQNIRDQRSIITEQIITVDEAYDTYGVHVDGKKISTYELTPIDVGGGAGYITSCAGMTKRDVDNGVTVKTLYERKSRKYPDGRMAVLVNDTLLYYGSLPYDEIPIVAQKSKDVAGCFFGKSFIEGEIPLQRAYNGVKNKTFDYIKTLASNTFIGEEGSVDISDYTDKGVEPGGFLPYKNGYEKPTVIQYPNIPTAIINQEKQIVADMEYFAGVSQLSVSGNTPNGIESGKAIQSLKNIDNTRISLSGECSRNAVRDLAILWLSIYKRYVKSYRVAKIVGDNEAGAILTWCGDDINSYDVDFNAENELLLSEDAQKENFITAFQLGLFTDDTGKIDKRFKEKALEMMKIGNYSEILGEGEIQKQNARRENSYFEKGVIPQRYELDDDAIHIDEHKKYALQLKFRIRSHKEPELSKLFINHIHEHENYIAKTNAMIQQQSMMAQGGAQNGREQ